jgi:hypothetical protein
MRLSGPQLNRLRYARKRQLFTADINRGNERRTYAALFKLGMLDWDPLLRGQVVLTAAGEQQLQELQEARRPPRPDMPRVKDVGVLRIKDVGDRRVITLTGVHGDKGKP